ncbi:MAG: hypothetical protein BJ554DRAFT_4802, partial [Olpidium bornovanus]
HGEIFTVDLLASEAVYVDDPLLAVHLDDTSLPPFRRASDNEDLIVFTDRHGADVILGPKLLREGGAHDFAPQAGGGREMSLAALAARGADVCMGNHLSTAASSAVRRRGFTVGGRAGRAGLGQAVERNVPEDRFMAGAEGSAGGLDEIDAASRDRGGRATSVCFQLRRRVARKNGPKERTVRPWPVRRGGGGQPAPCTPQGTKPAEAEPNCEREPEIWILPSSPFPPSPPSPPPRLFCSIGGKWGTGGRECSTRTGSSARATVVTTLKRKVVLLFLFVGGGREDWAAAPGPRRSQRKARALLLRVARARARVCVCVRGGGGVGGKLREGRGGI